MVTHQPRRCNPTVAWWLHIPWLEVDLQDPKVSRTDGPEPPGLGAQGVQATQTTGFILPVRRHNNPGRGGCDLIPRVPGKHKTWKETVARPWRLIAAGSTLAGRRLCAFLALQRQRASAAAADANSCVYIPLKGFLGTNNAWYGGRGRKTKPREEEGPSCEMVSDFASLSAQIASSDFSMGPRKTRVAFSLFY